MSKISEEEKSNFWKGISLLLAGEDILDLSIDKAYTNLMRTLSGFADVKNHDEIKENAKQSIKSSVEYIFGKRINNQKEYDKLHKEACDKLIATFPNKLLTYGQAQKWINMTFKYLYLLDSKKVERIYKFLHIPIDNYILRSAKPSKKIINEKWSKLNDYNKYLEYQIWFREEYTKEIPLDTEYYLWLKEAKKEKTKKREKK